MTQPGHRPALSIVIPVYNRANSISAAIASVFDQDFDDFELLIADDGSTDDLAAALAAFSDRRLQWLRSERNQGAAAARNRGIAAAQGHMVALLDSDDEWLPQRLAARVRFLEDQPEDVPVTIGPTLRHDLATGRTTPRGVAPGDDIRRVLTGCDLNPGSTLLARRAAFDAVGPFDEALARLEDWDWFLRYFPSTGGRLRVFPEAVAVVNVAPRAVLPAVRRAGAQMRAKHRSYLTRQGLSYALRFESGLKIEEAGAAFAAGWQMRAAVALGLALALWPPRFFMIAKRLIRRFSGG